MFKADFYEVIGHGKKWEANIFGGAHLIDVIEAKSEKQAHFLAKQRHPDAISLRERNKIMDEDYFSAQGRAYRAKQRFIQSRLESAS